MMLGVTSCNDETVTSPEKTKIFRYDESIQCESEGISLNEMSLELINADITVYCAQKNSDGLTRVALCGTSTGSINVYLIDSDDLAAAQSLGFESVHELEAYTDQSCE